MASHHERVRDHLGPDLDLTAGPGLLILRVRVRAGHLS